LVINILRDIIADVIDVNMKMRPLTSQSINSCIASWKRIESAHNDERISFETIETQYFELFN